MNWQTPATMACILGALTWLFWRNILPVLQGRGGGCCSKGCAPRQIPDPSAELQGLRLRPSQRNSDSSPIATRPGFDNL